MDDSSRTPPIRFLPHSKRAYTNLLSPEEDSNSKYDECFSSDDGLIRKGRDYKLGCKSNTNLAALNLEEPSFNAHHYKITMEMNKAREETDLHHEQVKFDRNVSVTVIHNICDCCESQNSDREKSNHRINKNESMGSVITVQIKHDQVIFLDSMSPNENNVCTDYNQEQGIPDDQICELGSAVVFSCETQESLLTADDTAEVFSPNVIIKTLHGEIHSATNRHGCTSNDMEDDSSSDFADSNVVYKTGSDNKNQTETDFTEKTDNGNAFFVSPLPDINRTDSTSSPVPLSTKSDLSSHNSCPILTSSETSASTVVLEDNKVGESSLSDELNTKMEKELIESNLRKQQIEMSRLKDELSLTKGKYSRILDDNVSLKSQLDDLRSQNSIFKCHAETKVLKVRQQYEQQLTELETRGKQLTQELETCQLEKVVLQRKLNEARQIMETSILVENELESVREQLKDCKAHREEDGEKFKQASLDIIKLRRFTSNLQQKVNEESLCNQQLAALEHRLKVMEDCLYQERADRASKLSDVEASLITENAKLQDFRNDENAEGCNKVLENIHHECDDLRKQLQREIKTLAAEKHEALAKAKCMEDMTAAISAENEFLRKCLQYSSRPSTICLTENNELQKSLCDKQMLLIELNAKEQALTQATTMIDKLKQGKNEHYLGPLMQFQIEELKNELHMKTTLLERLSNEKASQQVKLQSLHNNLHTVNEELTECRYQLKIKSLELEKEHEKAVALEANLRLLQQTTKVPVNKKPAQSTGKLLSEDEMKSCIMSYECETLKRDLKRAETALENVIKENTDLTSKMSELRQKLDTECGQVSRLENELHALREQRDAAISYQMKLEEDLRNLEVKMHQKEEQLREEAIKAKVDYRQINDALDAEIKKMALTLNINKNVIESQKQEIVILKDTLDHQNKEMVLKQQQIDVLLGENRKYIKEIDELKNTVACKELETREAVSSKYVKLEAEYNKLEQILMSHKVELERVQANLQTAQSSLAAMLETKLSLTKANQVLDKTVLDLRKKLLEKTETENLYRHKIEKLESELADFKNDKDLAEDRLREMCIKNKEQEEAFLTERMKCKELKKALSKTKSSQATCEQQCQSLQIQLARQQADINSLNNQLKTQEESLREKIRQLEFDLKEKRDGYQAEQMKWTQKEQLLSRDLQKAQQQIIVKNKKNLQLNDQILQLEQKLKESTLCAKQAHDTLTIERQKCEKLEKRIIELELTQSKLETKNMESLSTEAARSQIKRLVSEMSERIHSELSRYKETESEANDQLQRRIEQLKNQIRQLGVRLYEEEALHVISKRRISELETDKQRLREQLKAARRQNFGEADSVKSHCEKIESVVADWHVKACVALLCPMKNMHLSSAVRSFSMPLTDDGCISRQRYVDVFRDRGLGRPMCAGAAEDEELKEEEEEEEEENDAASVEVVDDGGLSAKGVANESGLNEVLPDMNETSS